MNPSFDIETILWLVLLIPSITVHEFAHGLAAYKLGDPTAKNAGRLTLNPLASIDPLGTVVLPLLMWAAGGPIFGYAKPVPYNPRYFKNLRQGELITGLAGPAANLSLAFAGSALAWLGFAVANAQPTGWVGVALWLVGFTLVRTNLVLMFFNLIPIPPLDGSSIVPIFLPDRMLGSWYRLQRYSFAILIGILWGLPIVLGLFGVRFDPITAYFTYTVYPLLKLLVPT